MTGTTTSVVVSEDANTSQTYVGEMDTAGGAPIAATSAPLTLTWAGANTAPQFSADSAPSFGTVGTAYSYPYVASGSPAPTFSVTSGTLPPGLTLNSISGTLAGVPTTASPTPYSFVVSAANSVSTVAGVTQSIMVTNAAVVVQEAATFPLNSELVMDPSITVNPQKPGDLMILSDQLHSTSVYVSAVSGGNSSTWLLAEQFVDTSNNLTYQVWYAVATGTGPANITLTYSAAASLQVELVADSFTTSRAVTWNVVTVGGVSNLNSTSVTFPTLTSGAAPGELYWGASEEHKTGVAGNTPGFVYGQTVNGNEYLYNADLGTNSTYSPIAGQTPTDVSTSVGVIFSAT